MIEREMSKSIGEISQSFPTLTITGPRQSGKTTLIKNVFKDYSYYSMEDLDVRRWAQSDPRDFLSQKNDGTIIDEVQNAPELLSYIQGIVDSDSSRRFVLSGSSNFALLKNVTQSLAGRTAILELLPLSIGEIQSAAEKTSLDEMMLNGFYPAVQAGISEGGYFYQNYVKTYLERDVRDLLAVKDLSRFQTFLRLCAGRIGSLFNASELSGEVGVSVNTILSWLSVLQASYIVFMLHPYHANTTKRMTKSPKLYFLDTGLACYLLGIETPSQLSRDKMRGYLFENMIITDALKHRFNQGKENNLWFFRTSRQEEVDLLMQYGSSFKAAEIKSAKTFTPDFLSGMKVLAKTYGDAVTEKAIVYSGEMEGGRDCKLINYLHFEDYLQ